MSRTLFFLLAALCVATTPHAGLVAYLPFDGDATDMSGNENHGTWDGTEAYTEGFDGAADGAAMFDGASIVSLTQAAGLPVTNEPEFSIAMWVKGPVQRDKRVFSEGSSSSNTPLFNLGTHNGGSTGQFNVFLRPGYGHRQTQWDAFDDTWHHVAWVDRNGFVDVYIDGVRDPRNLSYAREARDLDTTTFGAILRATVCCQFSGAIDEARIYDHALTEEDVQALIPTPGCPEDGDTHCDGLEIVHDGFGGVTATASATDDGGDTPIYTFYVEGPGGAFAQHGPQEANSIDLNLALGEWMITCVVDDELGCFDQAGDAVCSESIEIAPPLPQLIGKWSFDGDLLDSSGKDNDGEFVGEGEPNFVEGWDGTPNGAIEFAGDAIVRVNQNLGLPIYNNDAYTVAMWVKGPIQRDMRVFSEGSSTNSNPLLNVGTAHDAATGKVDIFIRFGGTQVSHQKSNREGFDESWHHVVWLETASGAGQIWIDGVFDREINYTRGAVPTLDRTTIGGIERANPSHFFTGTIDEVCIFNYALNADEIRELIPEPDSCPGDGDSFCENISHEGPETRTEGEYTISALGIDDSGDELWYFFSLTNPDGDTETIGPQRGNAITRSLSPGLWTASAYVDDDFICRDELPEATCDDYEIEVLSEPAIKISGFPFDGDLLDTEPAANDGTFVGGDAPTFVPGYDCGGAVLFDGSDDFVRLASNDGLPVTTRSSFSITMWVKGAAQRDKRIFSESNTMGNNNALFNLGTHNTGADGRLDFFYRANNGQSTGHRYSEGIVFDNTWHHIAWVDNNGEVSLYIDGELDGADLNYARRELTLDTATVGGILRGGPCCLFAGAIDDVMIFNYTLNQDEVLEIYGDGPAPQCCPEEGDTHVTGIDVDQTNGGGGILLVPRRTVLVNASAVDDSGDDITYTFTATGEFQEIVVGPQAGSSAEFELTPGPWSIRVDVDDDEGCDDVADDASMTIEVDICEVRGDTHALTLDVDQSDGAGGILLPRRTVAVTATGADDSGDEVIFTFTASGPLPNDIVIGPQSENRAIFELPPGLWTIRVDVDDDPSCDDVADDASLETTVDICPRDGDTTCVGLDIVGPDHGFPGEYVVTADASDSSGDAILYEFTADNGVDEPTVVMSDTNTAMFNLDVGTWTISVSVDDDPECHDTSDGATCSEEVTVVPRGGLQIPGDCNQDGNLDVADASCIFGVLFLGTPASFGCSDDPGSAGNRALIDWQPDGKVNLSDGVAALLFLFGGGQPHDLGVDCVRIVGCEDACTQ